MAIEARDLRFPLDAVPRDWHPDGVAVTSYWDQLSVFFPQGETFFVRSVRESARALTDPALKADIAAFCAQEGFHSREHAHYNERLAAEGLPVDRLEKVIRFFIDHQQRFLSPRRRLAVTCALEHFTSLMGELVLSKPELLEGADPQMAALWRWHSAEENEHRSVAFDLYRAVGGTWFERSRIMLLATVVFWLIVGTQQARFMWHRGAFFSPRQWWRLTRFLWGGPGALRTLVLPWLSYFAPGFHPARRGGFELVDAWKASQAA